MERKMHRPSLITIAVLAWASLPASANLFCVEPVTPSCLPVYGSFASKLEYASCRGEFESYIDSVERYKKCLRDEIDEADKKALSLVERFNRYAEGKKASP